MSAAWVPWAALEEGLLEAILDQHSPFAVVILRTSRSRSLVHWISSCGGGRGIPSWKGSSLPVGALVVHLREGLVVRAFQIDSGGWF